MEYIVDEEINLNETDALNSKSYSDTLKQTLLSTPKDKSFTVGLFGEWGSGKSSIVETVKTDLESNAEENIKFIIYDAWKYANDSFRRMFLLKIQEKLGFKKTELMNSFYLNESEDIEIKHKVSTAKLTVIVLILIAGLLVVNLIPMDSSELKLSLSLIISFLGLFATIFFKVFDEFKVNMQRPHLFAPEQFEDCFKEMISKSLKKYTRIESAFNWVQGNNHEKDIDKLIIVIDNIDRCNKELAYELLTDTKSFLGQTENVIFLIPVDDDALKQHILNSNACNKEAEEFLRKFFNVTIRIKPLKSVELFDFANKLNEKHNLGFNPDTLDIVSKEYATNPRRIIQFFNNLITETQTFRINFNDDFVIKNESLICKLLIIREEWPEYYKIISHNPHLFNGKSLSKNKILEDNEDLVLFLENTKALSKGIDISLFEQLLSNETVFKEIPDTLKQLVNNQKIDEINSFIEKEDKKAQVLNYLIEELRKGVTSERFATLTTRIFNIILELNTKNLLNEFDNHRIQNVIDGSLDKFINKIEKNIELVKYVDILFSQQIAYLSDFLIKLINSEYKSTKEVFDTEFATEIFGELIKSSNSIDLFKKLNEAFAIYFINQDESFTSLVSSKKVKPLYSDKIVEHILSKHVANLEEESQGLSDIIFITKNSYTYDSIKEKIFERFNAIYPNFTNRDKNYLLGIVKNITPLIKSFTYSHTFDQTRNFVSLLLANRPFNNQNINFLNEITGIVDEVQVIVDFLESIYIATKNKIDVSSYYNQIAISNSENRLIVNNSFLKLKDENGFHLEPVLDFIVSDTTYTGSSFRLLEHAFTVKGKENYRLNDDKLNNKVIEMSNFIFEEAEHYDDIISFFENHIDDERIKDSLADSISGKTKDEILVLSPTLLKLAFDKIVQNIFDYEEDLEVLKAIASSGEKSHLNKLAKVVVAKLLRDETLDAAFEILELSKPFNKRDSENIIGNLTNFLELEDYKEKVSELIDKLKQN